MAQSSFAADMIDPALKKRMAFVANRKIPTATQIEEDNLAAARRAATKASELEQRRLFEECCRMLLTEGDPLDGALLLRCLEEFRVTHKPRRRADTQDFESSIAFRVGARVFGVPNEIFDFERYTLIMQAADKVTVVAEGVRLTFRRLASRDSRRDSPQWMLESRIVPREERCKTEPRWAGVGHRSNPNTIRL